VPTLAVVEDFDEVKERRSGLSMRGERPAGEELALQGGEEALGQRVVIARGDVRTTWKAMKIGVLQRGILGQRQREEIVANWSFEAEYAR
jgi:hypothetical protein